MIVRNENKIINFLIEKEIFFILEGFRGFNLDFFRRINDNIKQVKYAQKHLPLLGKGTERTVFGLGSGKILKISHFIYGLLNQNREEIELYFKSKIPKEYLAKIYDYDHENYNWIISEAVQVIADNQHLKRKFNVTNNFLRIFVKNIKNKNKSFYETIKNSIIDFGNFEKNNMSDLNKLDLELLKTVYTLTKLNVEDIARLEHWGMTTDEKIVVVDFGMHI